MAYFDKQGIKYEVRDIEKDKQASKEIVDKSGQMGIPVIDIDGTIIVGFDRARINTVLKDKKLI